MNFTKLVSIIMLLGFTPTVCQEPKLSPQKATGQLIAYFDDLVCKDIINIDNLNALKDSETLINPIPKIAADNSHSTFIHFKQLNQIIENHGNNLFDVQQVKDWAAAKLVELQNTRAISHEVYEKTTELHHEMHFVGIPAGKYISAIDNTEFVIPEGIEIQITPITQYQWLQLVMSHPAGMDSLYAPSQFNDGIDSETIAIGDKKVTIRPDHPVESITYHDIINYLSVLNRKDGNYSYFLPSVNEYEALLQISIGKDWVDQIRFAQNLVVDSDQTASVASGHYLNFGVKRIMNIIGNVWEFTRDQVKVKAYYPAHLVFGASYATTKSSLSDIRSFLRPVLYTDTRGSSIGFRLVRKKINDPNNINNIISYNPSELDWPRSIVEDDNHWQVPEPGNIIIHNDDSARYIIEHKSKYPQAIQHTINALIKSERIEHSNQIRKLKSASIIYLEGKEISDISILSKLQLQPGWVTLSHNRITDVNGVSQFNQMYSLNMMDNHIADINPLAKLTNLRHITLGANKISDISALAGLANIEALLLENNHIQDISPLAFLKNLNKLSLMGNPIKDLSALKELENLTELYLDSEQIERLKPHEFLNPRVKIIDGK